MWLVVSNVEVRVRCRKGVVGLIGNGVFVVCVCVCVIL